VSKKSLTRQKREQKRLLHKLARVVFIVSYAAAFRELRMLT
jgi:hypothetical protein